MLRNDPRPPARCPRRAGRSLTPPEWRTDSARVTALRTTAPAGQSRPRRRGRWGPGCGGLARGRSGQEQAGHGRGGQDRARRAGALPSRPPTPRPITAQACAARPILRRPTRTPPMADAAHTALDDAARSGSVAEQVVAPTGVALSPAMSARGCAARRARARVPTRCGCTTAPPPTRSPAPPAPTRWPLGRDVHFRQGRYRPHDAAGSRCWPTRPPTCRPLLEPARRGGGPPVRAGADEEVRGAPRPERAASRRLAATPLPARRRARGPAIESARPAAVPMTALAGRDVGPEASAARPAPACVAGPRRVAAGRPESCSGCAPSSSGVADMPSPSVTRCGRRPRRPPRPRGARQGHASSTRSPATSTR